MQGRSSLYIVDRALLIFNPICLWVLIISTPKPNDVIKWLPKSFSLQGWLFIGKEWFNDKTLKTTCVKLNKDMICQKYCPAQFYKILSVTVTLRNLWLAKFILYMYRLVKSWQFKRIGKKCQCYGTFGWDHKTKVPCNSTNSTLKNPNFSMNVTVEHRSKFEALRR